jgi:hypothetical protein
MKIRILVLQNFYKLKNLIVLAVSMLEIFKFNSNFNSFLLFIKTPPGYIETNSLT